MAIWWIQENAQRQFYTLHENQLSSKRDQIEVCRTKVSLLSRLYLILYVPQHLSPICLDNQELRDW